MTQLASSTAAATRELLNRAASAYADDRVASDLIHQLQRGCEVSEATLAFDVVREVVAADSVFLGHPHTVEHMRRGALWLGEISVRGAGTDGEAPAGVRARARARVTELLQTHTVEPLPDDVDRQLTEIMAQARRELVE